MVDYVGIPQGGSSSRPMFCNRASVTFPKRSVKKTEALTLSFLPGSPPLDTRKLTTGMSWDSVAHMIGVQPPSSCNRFVQFRSGQLQSIRFSSTQFNQWYFLMVPFICSNDVLEYPPKVESQVPQHFKSSEAHSTNCTAPCYQDRLSHSISQENDW